MWCSAVVCNTAFSMRIDRLTLSGFRNYETESLSFDPSCNVIYGENAQGKTNLLEAIVYLSCGKSPRTRTDRDLISFDRQEAKLRGEIFARERPFVTEIALQKGRRRKMTVNGVTAKNGAALSDVLHTVFFSPEDLFLIRDGAAARRRFMDLSLCQLRPRYAEALAEYHRLYEHKTRILRDSEEQPSLLSMLPDFNEQMCRAGAVLIHYRARYCQALDRYAAPAHEDCSGGREKPSVIKASVPLKTRWRLRPSCWKRCAAIRRSMTVRSGPAGCACPVPIRMISWWRSTVLPPGSIARRGRCVRQRWP